MKQYKIKNQHYSYLKMILRIATIIVAVWSLFESYQNKQHIKWLKEEIVWLQKENDNIIEKLMFPENTELEKNRNK